MATRPRPIIGVIGAGRCSEEIEILAADVGRAIAAAGGILVCGGLGGVMEAAARGAKEKEGMTIGILPGSARSDANEFIEVPIPTGMSEARNVIIINTADAVIALPGKYGTLSEMAFCLKSNKPLITVGNSWEISESVEHFESPEDAVKKALELVG